jgi:ABC-type phosphate transport system auxiliary subunit
LAEYSKYDILIKDLTLIESQVSILSSKYKEEILKNQEMEKSVQDLRKENTFLVDKLSKLESELESLHSGNNQDLFHSLNMKEKEELKLKLRNLLSKIDYHISS